MAYYKSVLEKLLDQGVVLPDPPPELGQRVGDVDIEIQGLLDSYKRIPKIELGSINERFKRSDLFGPASYPGRSYWYEFVSSDLRGKFGVWSELVGLDGVGALEPNIARMLTATEGIPKYALKSQSFVGDLRSRVPLIL